MFLMDSMLSCFVNIILAFWKIEVSVEPAMQEDVPNARIYVIVEFKIQKI